MRRSSPSQNASIRTVSCRPTGAFFESKNSSRSALGNGNVWANPWPGRSSSSSLPMLWKNSTSHLRMGKHCRRSGSWVSRSHLRLMSVWSNRGNSTWMLINCKLFEIDTSLVIRLIQTDFSIQNRSNNWIIGTNFEVERFSAFFK